jgi:hypothetical protein
MSAIHAMSEPLQRAVADWSPQKDKLFLLSDLSKEEKDLVYDKWFDQFRYQSKAVANKFQNNKTQQFIHSPQHSFIAYDATTNQI